MEYVNTNSTCSYIEAYSNELESQKAFYWIRIDSILFYSIEYDSTWEHVGFVLSYSIEYEKHWVMSK
jgi:hypothetical protein